MRACMSLKADAAARSSRGPSSGRRTDRSPRPGGGGGTRQRAKGAGEAAHEEEANTQDGYQRQGEDQKHDVALDLAGAPAGRRREHVEPSVRPPGRGGEGDGDRDRLSPASARPLAKMGVFQNRHGHPPVA
jgi:hypothetical protein